MAACAASKSTLAFLALHVAIDDHSRIAFTQMLPDQKAETTIGFLLRGDRVLRHAPNRRHSRPAHTDNGSCYRPQSFAKPARVCQIKHHRTRPYTPRTNGKAEALYPDRSQRVGLLPGTGPSPTKET